MKSAAFTRVSAVLFLQDSVLRFVFVAVVAGGLPFRLCYRDGLPPASLVFSASAESTASDSEGHTFGVNVVQLTDDNFDQKTKSGHSFVMYYADWCGHCKRLIPVWSQLAADLEGEGGEVLTFAAILATDFRRNIGSALVKHYPTLLWFHDGSPTYMYEEERSEQSLKKFVGHMMSRTEEQLADLKRQMEQELSKRISQLKQQREQEEAELEKAAARFMEEIEEVKDLTWNAQLSGKSAIVMYYADWCQHCKHFKPIMLRLADELSSSDLHLFRVDSSKQDRRNPGMQYVAGLPTVLFLHDSQILDVFSGGGFDQLKAWVEPLISLSEEEREEKIVSLGKKTEATREAQEREERERAKEEQRRKEEEMRKARLKKRRQQDRQSSW